MIVKTITYKAKTQSVKDWSIELNIPTNRIYSRLRLGWPPELVLSKRRFHFCNNLLAARRMEEVNGYPQAYHDEKTTSCCNQDTICKWAIALTSWDEVKYNPSKGNYYCSYKSTYEGDFICDSNPTCNK